MKKKSWRNITLLFSIVLFSFIFTFGLIESAIADYGELKPQTGPAELPSQFYDYDPRNPEEEAIENNEIFLDVITPVQSALDPQKGSQIDNIIDLVVGKPTIVIVKFSETTLLGSPPFPSIDLLVDDLQPPIQASPDDNRLAIFELGLLEVGEHELSIPAYVDIADLIINVKETRDLKLYWGWMDRNEFDDIIPPISDIFSDFTSLSSSFLESVYPVKNVVNSFDELAYNQVKVKKQNNMEKDCIRVAIDALENNYEVGVSVVPTLYFDEIRGWPNAVGVSFGPNTKGVIVAYDYPTVTAHEVAHTYWVYWGEPENYEQNYPYGSWVGGIAADTLAVNSYWRTGYSFMGVAFNSTTTESWVNSICSFNELFFELSDNIEDPKVVFVSGIFINGNNTDYERPFAWTKSSNGIPSKVTPGNHWIQFYKNGNLINATSFDIWFNRSVNQGVEVGDVPLDATTVPHIGYKANNNATFAFAVEEPLDYDEIRIVYSPPGGGETIIDTILADEIISIDDGICEFLIIGIPLIIIGVALLVYFNRSNLLFLIIGIILIIIGLLVVLFFCTPLGGIIGIGPGGILWT